MTAPVQPSPQARIAPNPPPPPPAPPPPLMALEGAELARRLVSGQVSAEAAMEAALEQIGRLNGAWNAIVSLRPAEELLAEARAADRRRARNGPDGPLHGVPMAIKDLADAAGLPTSRGSPLLAGAVAGRDGLLAARLRKAGAIFVGKTNTPEWGLGSQTYNGVHGATGCAWDPARTAGGSSGGAAAALALRMLPLADGSDMMGSLRNPAAFNNVYGLRPSMGRVPDPDAPELFFAQLATEGPMGRTPRDMALLMDVIAGPHPGAPLSLPAQRGGYLGALGRPARGARIGWIGDWDGRYALEPGVAELCESALGEIERMGCRATPVRPDFDPERLWRAWLDLRSFFVSARLAPLAADPLKRAALKPEALWEVERGAALTAERLQAAAQARSDWFRALMGLFARFDALALPAAQVFPFDIRTPWPERIGARAMQTYHQWMEVVVPGSMSPCPSVAVPAGFDARGLPMGLQLIFPPRADLAALRFADAYERARAMSARLPPQLAP
ncbi:amidase [Oceanicella actignis]|uniref:amidase n=1 Tax=Oceanicella actignis TaxID=1189325 RepID=UPI0011E7D2E4|nr:amidase [Oceanicella actignis]TYO89638.1 amidase [Oceanicella actignis]